MGSSNLNKHCRPLSSDMRRIRQPDHIVSFIHNLDGPNNKYCNQPCFPRLLGKEIVP